MNRVVLVTPLLVFGLYFAACGGPKKLCNPDNCASGCCTVASNGDQVCNPGNVPDLCGSGGAECIECATGQQCSLGACIDPSAAGGGMASGGGVGGGGMAAGGGGGGGDVDAGSDAGETMDAGMDAGFGTGLCANFGPFGGGSGGGGGGGGTAGYPAAHPPFPTSESYGGNVLTAPQLVSVTFNNYPANLRDEVDCFVSSIGTTPYFLAATQEYGVGTPLALDPVHLTEDAPTSLSDNAIKTWLKGKITNLDPAFPPPSDQNLYVIYYPKQTKITYGGQQSCYAFGGYHGSVQVNGTGYAYAVVPDCGQFFNGLPESADLTSAGSHEIIEAVTDPFEFNPAYAVVDQSHFIWEVILLSEVGDLCAQDMASFYQPPGYPFTVQRTWSNDNSRIAVGGDPCVPELPGEVYFNSVPDQDDNVHLTIQGQTIMTKGIKIPIGGTKTVDLHLFSEAPSGDWNVGAYDMSQIFGGATPQYLDMQLSNASGNNGDTLQLTIKYIGPDNLGTGGAAFFVSNQGANGTTSYIGYVSSN